MKDRFWPPRVVLLRGAPAVGKSSAARAIADLLSSGTILEIDAIRRLRADCDWHDRRQHTTALAEAASAVISLAARDLQPILVVDTFGRFTLPNFQARLESAGIAHTTVSLWSNQNILEARSVRRGDSEHELAMSMIMNSEIEIVRWPHEWILDTSHCSPLQVAQQVVTRTGWEERYNGLLARRKVGSAP